MKYINATDLLPTMLVEELQEYVQAGYLYIPAKDDHKAWGEVSGYRKELARRNQAIKTAFAKGSTMDALAQQYHLSIYAIRKIIYQK